MAVRGIGAYFALGSGTSPGSPDNVSGYLNNIAKNNDVERLDATVFQPNVQSPVKMEINGFTTKGYTLTGVWTAAADAFFAGIDGDEGVDYEYGPEGSQTGDTKYSGLCNVLTYSGPQSSVSTITSFTVELSVTSETRGTFS